MPSPLTPAQRAALEYAALYNNVQSGCLAGGGRGDRVAKRTIRALVTRGLLASQARGAWYTLTPAGRAALEEAEHGK